MRIKLFTVIAAATLLAACKSGPRIEGCDEDPSYYTLVRVSGDLGSLGPSCQLNSDRFALAMRLSVPEGTSLALGNDPWTADADGIYWLDLRPWLMDLPSSMARGFAERVEGPIGIPVVITTSAGEQVGEIRLEVGSVRWPSMLRSVEDGFVLPEASEGADPTSLAYVRWGADTVFLGNVERLRDLRYVAVGTNEEERSDTCGPYEVVTEGGGMPFSITRVQYRTDVVVYDAHTGERVAEQSFQAAPEPCPGYATEGQRAESRPDEETVTAWLETARLRP